MNSKLLFNRKRLSDLIQAYEKNIREEIKSWDKNRVLAASGHDLIEYLVQEYTLDAPNLLPDKKFIEERGETKIDVSNRIEYGGGYGGRGNFNVPGFYIKVAIPFEGDADLFDYRASTFSMNPPRCQIAGSNLILTIQDVELKHEQIEQKINCFVRQCEQYLEWTKQDCRNWNNSIQRTAEQHLSVRRENLLKHENLVKALGIPIKRRTDTSTVFSVPIKRKKRPVFLPPTPKGAFKPEPSLPDDEYNYILSVIERLAKSIERSPSTFADMEEEQIRDIILVDLNGHYEGNATGETFNSQGKTDILIREKDRSVFIAECKFWKGKKELHAAIDQILGYLTWRDSKTALLIFSKNMAFSNVLSSLAENIPKHSNFKKELQKVNDNHVRYVFSRRGDPGMDLYLAVLAFNIPIKAG